MEDVEDDEKRMLVVVDVWKSVEDEKKNSVEEMQPGTCSPPKTMQESSRPAALYSYHLLV